jgi:hypothetical protein
VPSPREIHGSMKETTYRLKAVALTSG